MKQEHSNSNFDKKLREKFKDTEFTPPSFDELMSGAQAEWESTWQQNLPNSSRQWRSILIYSLVLGFLLPLLLLQSDIQLISSDTESNSQNTLLFSELGPNSKDFKQKTRQQEQQQATGLSNDSKSSEEPKASSDNKLKASDSNNIITNSSNQTSFTRTVDEAFLGNMIPEKSHKIFSNSYQDITQQPARIKHPKSFIKQELQSLSKQPISVLSAVALENSMPIIPHVAQKEVQTTHQVQLPKTTKGEFYLGLMGCLYSPWILNQNTYGAFNGYEFAYAFNFETKVRLRAGYNSNRKWGAEVGFVLNSHQGQHYEDNILGKLQTREVGLDYWQIPIHLKHRKQLRPESSLPAVVNLEVGFVYNKLKSAQEIINHGAPTDITNRFRSSMWQASFGISTDFYFSDHFFATVGLRSQFSNDINSINWRVSDSYGKSHSLLLGAEVGISYRIR